MPEPVDGFTLDPTLRPLPHTAGALQVSVIEELRQAHNFRPRWYTIPSVGAGLPLTLPAREMREYQIRVEPGSWWWGWQSSSAFFGFGLPFSFTVTEESTGRKLSSDLKLSYTDYLLEMAPGPVAGWPFTPYMKYGVNFLGEPWLILEPGLLNVELYNIDLGGPFGPAACQPQVILMMAEPVCSAVREMNPCS